MKTIDEDIRDDVAVVRAAMGLAGLEADDASAETFWRSYSGRFGSSWKRLENHSLPTLARIAAEELRT